ncbi:DUF433 domain-containing protein [Crinalium epipsammum]|uniref:DUF433 domain-containing protein n=1 Tax=Crinalium epipsammum TaxID=241425 RepID=UPI0002E68AF2|nr:DUF433 domain-containing protein [Crinalium epipsammum]
MQTLLDYLKAGESINDFLDGFPTVTREQVIALLEETEKQIVRIEEALRQYIQRRQQMKVLELFCTIDYEKDYNYKQQRQAI